LQARDRAAPPVDGGNGGGRGPTGAENVGAINVACAVRRRLHERPAEEEAQAQPAESL